MYSILLTLTLLQPPVKNPTAVLFTASIDHATISHYELDIVSGATVVQTLNLGKPTPDAQNDVTAPINVQPIAFGTYTFKARAVAGAVKSIDTAPSDPWERAPGPPGTPRAGGDE